MTATYLYAIIPTKYEIVFDVASENEDDYQVYTIPHNNLAAVVSASPLADYKGLKRDEAAQYLV
ncbi:MAG: GvpL/GvpF family gas vesicle protein, partial [Chloroflexi bacterium]|nr:GvpL/GvpF family gas vesicle protein [Chloroflexota bacterium]